MESKHRTTKHPKFIFISGGVISGVGKGITSASISALLQARGYKVAPVKADAYLNVDAGTIRPQEHGEVFVTKDGMECDQDLGNYERFLNTELSAVNYMTNGQIFQTIIQKERNFEYEGEDVEVATHVPEEIIRRLDEAGKEINADFVICEIGGTVGEYQNILFIEANRTMKYRYGRECVHVHVGYLPTPPSIGEMKSKPVQNSVKQLIASGIQPDFLIARAEQSIDSRRKQTLAWTTNIPAENIIAAPNVTSIYAVPLNFEKEKLVDGILRKFNLPIKKPSLFAWTKLNKNIHSSAESKPINIAIVGKYFETGDYQLADVYVSVIEAMKHAAWQNKVQPNLHWISSSQIEQLGAAKVLSKFDAICVPGGFGSRGIEGIIAAIKFAREKNIPYLGLCYGMQLATIEFARNVCGLKDAHTTEVNPKTNNPIIHIMPQQLKNLLAKNYGGSMRLGNWDCKIKPKTLAAKLFKLATVSERHRHRYEFNTQYKSLLEENGLVFSGFSNDGQLMEIVELPSHKYFIASQFHPEFKSSPFKPHPMFSGFVKAAAQ